MSAVYETSKLLAEYLLFHFAKAEEILPPGRDWPESMRKALGFTRRTVAHFSKTTAASGLDLGCAVGGSTFEMAKFCTTVTGIDFSKNFIDAADALRRGETINYARHEEAHIETTLVARAPQDSNPHAITFLHGDAMDLPASLGSFDRVHAANLICRLPKPQALLDRLPSLVNPGGELVLATPCTWLSEFTPPANWPTGSTLDWLIQMLAPHFELKHQCEEAFLIRETARKFQWSSSLVTVWQSK